MSSQASPTYDPVVHAILCERLGFLFAKLHQRWNGESIAAMREAGLGLSAMHMGALSVVESAGPMSQQVLGEHLKKDRTTIVAVVDELEGEGLLERRRNPSDRRAYALEVTEEGRAWLSEAQPLLTAVEERMLASLDPQERTVLRSLLQRVLLGDPD